MFIAGITRSAPVGGLTALVRLLLHPVVTGTLLAALRTQDGRARISHLVERALSALPAALSARLTTGITPEAAHLALRLVFGYGALRALNAAANAASENSWRFFGRAPGNWADGGSDWSRELAVVTGGCSGIGLRVVEQLAARGVRVAVLDVQPLPKNLEGHRRIRYVRCDVTDPEAVRAAADAVRVAFAAPSNQAAAPAATPEHPTILINNAGITIPHGILEMPPDSLLKVFQVNTLAHWYLAQAFVPAMKRANKGHVVTVASVASFLSLTKGADYSCTKASAHAFHESLSSELRAAGADGVLTSVIHPSFVRTPLVADFTDKLEKAGISLLTVQEVASSITRQVFNAQGAQVVCPGRMSPITSFRAWPAWLQNMVRDQIAGSSKNL